MFRVESVTIMLILIMILIIIVSFIYFLNSINWGLKYIVPGLFLIACIHFYKEWSEFEHSWPGFGYFGNIGNSIKLCICGILFLITIVVSFYIDIKQSMNANENVANKSKEITEIELIAEEKANLLNETKNQKNKNSENVCKCGKTYDINSKFCIHCFEPISKNNE